MPKRALTFSFAACLFLLIVGAKWATFERFGSPMPDWDQWDAEAVELFIPWFENDQFLKHLFHPHNEHRVILTKLQNLALGLLNGQWDSRLEAVTNAILHAAVGVGFWLCACGWIGAAPVSAGVSNTSGTGSRTLLPAALFLITAALFGLPLAWQNILGGFHSQQYWLLGLSFVAIITLPFAAAWSRSWWLGAIAATLALGSMGSGFLAAAVVLVVIGWRLAVRETTWRAMAPALALAVALVAAGLATHVDVAWHQDLKAKTAHDFFFSIVHSLQWPMRDRDWAAVVMWLPWALVAWCVARKTADAAGQTILALGGWVLVQVFATAYARGAGADYPASRYMDTLVFGAMANACALGWLLTQRASATARANRPFFAWVVIALAWVATLASGLHEITDRNLYAELPDAKRYYIKAEGHMRRYLGTNDPKQLAYPDIPFPSADGLVERLGHSSLRALMPLPIRTPLKLTPAGEAPAFQENDARGSDVERPPRAGMSPQTPPLDWTKSWGSFTAEKGAGAVGTWRSAPLAATLRGWLKFETAGQVGDPNEGVLLELRDARTDALLARIRPDRVPGEAWRSAYVRAPREPFVVVAEDRHAARWLAFSGPSEMGALSYFAWRATKRGLFLVYFAAAATLALTAVALASRRRRDGAAPANASESSSAAGARVA